MAKTVVTPDPALYCRKCSYDLRGQIEHRCPECGRPYDPADAKTFRRRPRGRAGKWIKRIAVAMAAFLLIAASPYAWLYYDWRREQPAVARMNALGAELSYKHIDVPVLPRLVPDRYGWMLQRVHMMAFPCLGLTDADMGLLSRCRRLEGLFVSNSSVSDKGIEAVSQLPKLRWVELRGEGITDASAEHLARCSQLEKLRLYHTSLSDAGLAHLCRLPHLQSLSLESPALTDAGLPSLAALPRLSGLTLYAPLIDDNGLATLSRLSGLQFLGVDTDRCTRGGQERLRQALPKCVITVDRYTLDSAPSTLPSL